MSTTYEIVERLIAGDAEAVQMHTLAKGAKPGNPRIAEQPRDERGRVLPKTDPVGASRIDNNVNNTDSEGRSSPVGNTAEAGIRRLSKEAAGGMPVSMLTTEIAALTKKRHDNVMRDTKRMLLELHGERGVLSFEDTLRNLQNGQEYPCFRLPKREVMILVTGYSIPLRAAEGLTT